LICIEIAKEHFFLLGAYGTNKIIKNLFALGFLWCRSSTDDNIFLLGAFFSGVGPQGKKILNLSGLGFFIVRLCRYQKKSKQLRFQNK